MKDTKIKGLIQIKEELAKYYSLGLEDIKFGKHKKGNDLLRLKISIGSDGYTIWKTDKDRIVKYLFEKGKDLIELDSIEHIIALIDDRRGK